MKVMISNPMKTGCATKSFNVIFSNENYDIMGEEAYLDFEILPNLHIGNHGGKVQIQYGAYVCWSNVVENENTSKLNMLNYVLMLRDFKNLL